MTTVTLAVAGMMCSHCEARVSDALMKLNGISNVLASADANQVICTYDEQTILETAIIETIQAVGYDVK